MFDRFQSRSLVLMYHRISQVEPDVWSMCVSPRHFEEHLDVLRRYRTVRLDQLRAGCWYKGSLTCAITFDDGYADNLHVAQRLLGRFGIPGTFFITTGYIDSDREFWWDELERLVYRNGGLSLQARRERYLGLYRRLQPLDHKARQRFLNDLPGSERTARDSYRSLTAQELMELGSDD